MELEIILQLAQGLFFLITILAGADYLHYRDRVRLEILLLFAAISMVIFYFTFGQEYMVLEVLATISVIVQPYLLLQLVQSFRTVPRWLNIGTTATALIFVIWALATMPNYPDAIVIGIVLYLITIGAYVSFAFIRGATKSRGITRWRLLLVSTGTNAFALTMLLVVLVTYLDEILPYVTPFAILIVFIIPITYYLGFSPPQSLRRVWQNSEMRRFLRELSQLALTIRTAEVSQILQETTLRITGGHAALVARWDYYAQSLFVVETTSPIKQLDVSAGVLGQVWNSRQGKAVRQIDTLEEPIYQLATYFDAGTVFIVPIALGTQLWGVLLVFFLQPSLFEQDELDLLALLTEQAAFVLSYDALLTEQEQLVEELRQQKEVLEAAQDEIKKLNEGLERRVQERTAQLEAVNHELEAFAYTVSHDLRAPLRALRGYSQFLREDCGEQLSELGWEYVYGIEESAGNMDNLIIDLLKYSRIGRTKPERTPIDLNLFLPQIIDHLNLPIDVTIQLPSQLPTIYTSMIRLEQIFSNLISNAAKFHRPNTPPIVQIEWSEKDAYWEFFIRDNGIGIDAKHFGKIFGIFQRLHTQEEYEGTGIGLAIVKKAIEEQGGTISVESVVDKGSCFRFTILKLLQEKE